MDIPKDKVYMQKILHSVNGEQIWGTNLQLLKAKKMQQ